MIIAWVVIEPAENSDAKCDIWPSGGHCVHEASNHQLVYGRVTGFCVGLPLMKLHRHWRGNSSGLINSELRQDCGKGAVLMDGDCVMLRLHSIFMLR
jgi:hypothetical protein